MSRLRHSRQNIRHTVKWLRQHSFKNSPCGRAPKAPVGLTSSWDRNEGGKHNKIRANLRWTETHYDIDDFPVIINHYVCEVDFSANGVDWAQAKRFNVPAKSDDDADNKHHVIFKGISARMGYRYRVRAVDGNGGCTSAWSDFYTMGVPNPDVPPAPYDVQIHGKGKKHHAIAMRWHAALNNQDGDLYDDKINHFVAEISKSSTFNTSFDKNPKVGGRHVSFVIDDADLNQNYYGRVRSVSSEGRTRVFGYLRRSAVTTTRRLHQMVRRQSRRLKSARSRNSLTTKHPWAAGFCATVQHT